MADVEGRRCRVETAIQADRSVRQSAAERLAPGGLHDESSPGELVQDGMHRSVPLGWALSAGGRPQGPGWFGPCAIVTDPRLLGAARIPRRCGVTGPRSATGRSAVAGEAAQRGD